MVNSIFDGVLERPAILFITNTKHDRGWSINATNFLISLIVSTHMGILEEWATVR